MPESKIAVVAIEQADIDDPTGASIARRFDASARATVVDLSRVVSIGSAGVRALVRASKRGGSFFALAVPQPTLREVFAIGHIHLLVPIFPSLKAARAAARG